MTAWMSWSSGKDSAYALHVARTELELDVTGLLVTLNAAADRVSMHAVRRTLVEAQAASLGLPLHVVELPSPCPNDVYEQTMAQAMDDARAAGVRAVVFGDLFLADVRAYREANLAGTGIDPAFPLWGRPTDALAREMIAAGVRAVVTTLDPSVVPVELSGRDFDEAFLAALPHGVDPCGERGEFHTFVTDAPGFAEPVPVEPGQVAIRDGVVFRDLVPAA